MSGKLPQAGAGLGHQLAGSSLSVTLSMAGSSDKVAPSARGQDGSQEMKSIGVPSWAITVRLSVFSRVRLGPYSTSTGVPPLTFVSRPTPMTRNWPGRISSVGLKPALPAALSTVQPSRLMGRAVAL